MHIFVALALHPPVGRQRYMLFVMAGAMPIAFAMVRPVAEIFLIDGGIRRLILVG